MGDGSPRAPPPPPAAAAPCLPPVRQPLSCGGRGATPAGRAPAASSSAAPPAAASAARLRYFRYYCLRLSVNGGAGHVGAARAAQREPVCGVRAVGVRAPRARSLAGARARGEPQPSRGCRRAGPGRRAAARWPGGRRGRAPSARRSPRHAAAVARSRSSVAVASQRHTQASATRAGAVSTRPHTPLVAARRRRWRRRELALPSCVEQGASSSVSHARAGHGKDIARARACRQRRRACGAGGAAASDSTPAGMPASSCATPRATWHAFSLSAGCRGNLRRGGGR
jgi:hypothetical protein